MAERYKLRVGTRIDGKIYRPGSVVELDEELKETQQVKDLFENDYLEPIEEDTEEEQEEEEETRQIDRTTLTAVEGIGDTYADRIIAEFESVEALQEASVEEIAEVQGVNAPLAEEVKEVIEE